MLVEGTPVRSPLLAGCGVERADMYHIWERKERAARDMNWWTDFLGRRSASLPCYATTPVVEILLTSTRTLNSYSHLALHHDSFIESRDSEGRILT